MNTGLNHDDAIDKTLDALRGAAPPEGMEARIASRIAQQIASPATTHIASLAPSASWWRGAIAGAAFATLLMGLLSIRHLASTRGQNPDYTAANSQAQQSSSPHPASMNSSAALDSPHRPCLRVALLPTVPSAKIAPQLIAQDPLKETSAPSRPAPVLPLTLQERELAHLARTSDPHQLAAIGLDEEARLEAERATELALLFAQRTAVQPTESTPDAATESTTATNPPDQSPVPEAANSSTSQEDQK